MKSLRIGILVIGILALLFAMLMGAAGVLGFAGILADIGPEDNRKMGFEALSIAAISVSVSIALFVVLYVLSKLQSSNGETG